MEKYELKPGMLVQIDPESDPIFGGHFMVITEPKSFGAQGYCPAFGRREGEETIPGGFAYYRCRFENMEIVGRAEWVQGIEEKELE